MFPHCDRALATMAPRRDQEEASPRARNKKRKQHHPEGSWFGAEMEGGGGEG